AARFLVVGPSVGWNASCSLVLAVTNSRLGTNLQGTGDDQDEIVVVTSKQYFTVADDFLRRLFPDLTPNLCLIRILSPSSSRRTTACFIESQGELVVLNQAEIKNDRTHITPLSTSTKRDALRVSAIYRDPSDVRTVIHLARSGIVLTLLLLISVIGNFYQY